MPFAEAFTRFGVGAALAMLTGGVWVLARRHRPRSWWTFLWLAPFLLTTWSGLSTTSWGGRFEYELECRERWDQRAGALSGSSGVATATTWPAAAASSNPGAPPSRGNGAGLSRARFMGECIDEVRAHAQRRRADPDAACNWEERSGCPGHDYRGLWLGIAGLGGAGGLVVSIRPFRREPVS
jgi:hypothetical protein